MLRCTREPLASAEHICFCCPSTLSCFNSAPSCKCPVWTTSLTRDTLNLLQRKEPDILNQRRKLARQFKTHPSRTHCHVFQLFVWKTLQGLCDLGPRSLLLTPCYPCSILLPLQTPGPDQAWATLQRRKQNRTPQWKGSGFGDQALRVSESDRHLVLALWPWPNSLVSVPPFPHL